MVKGEKNLYYMVYCKWQIVAKIVKSHTRYIILFKLSNYAP